MSGEPGQGEGPSVPQPDKPKTEADSQKAAERFDFKSGLLSNPWPNKNEAVTNALEDGDRLVDEPTTVLKTSEIERAAKDQWSDITLPAGTVLALTVHEKTGEDGEEQEKALGSLRLGSDLRVGIGAFGWKSGGYGNAEFTPSSDKEGELRRQTAAVHKQSEPLRVKDLMGEDLSAEEVAERDRLVTETDRLNAEVNAVSEESKKKFVEARAELLRARGVDPEKVTDVGLKTKIYEFGSETPPRLNRELREPSAREEVSEEAKQALGEKFAALVRERDTNFAAAIGGTIEDAIRGLEIDYDGKEKHLTQQQVEDLWRAFFRTSIDHLSSDDKLELFRNVNTNFFRALGLSVPLNEYDIRGYKERVEKADQTPPSTEPPEVAS